jgi:hypothetical protein
VVFEELCHHSRCVCREDPAKRRIQYSSPAKNKERIEARSGLPASVAVLRVLVRTVLAVGLVASSSSTPSILQNGRRSDYRFTCIQENTDFFIEYHVFNIYASLVVRP